MEASALLGQCRCKYHSTQALALMQCRLSCNWAADWLHCSYAGPLVEAARLPRVCHIALGYGLLPLQ